MAVVIITAAKEEVRSLSESSIGGQRGGQLGQTLDFKTKQTAVCVQSETKT